MYRVIIDPEVVDQIAALPAAALIEYARVHDVLEVVPFALRRRSGNITDLTIATRHDPRLGPTGTAAQGNRLWPPASDRPDAGHVGSKEREPEWTRNSIAYTPEVAVGTDGIATAPRAVPW